MLRTLKVEWPNQIWAMDITYVPMARGYVYLTAVVDWYPRRVMAWRRALASHGAPEIFNTDQGSQFTSAAFTRLLKQHAIAINMDGKGCWRDNVLVERLWKSVKYEEVYLKACATVSEARAGDGRTPSLSGARPIRSTSTDHCPCRAA